MQPSTAERIAAATPVTRNRVVDLLRVAASLGARSAA